MIPRKLSNEIERWIREEKFGNIQINFVGGRITNVNRTESMKVDSIGDVIGTITVSRVSETNINPLPPKAV